MVSETKKKYYVVINGQQIGPLSIEEFKLLNLPADALVWREGLKDWAQLSQFSNKEYVSKKTSTEQTYSQVQNKLKKINLSIKKPKTKASTPEASGYKKASGLIRLTGFLINMSPFFIAIFFSDSDYFHLFMLYLFIPFASALFYHKSAGNFGHDLLGLKVIDANSSEDFNNPIKGALREALKIFMLVFFIPVIWLFFNKNKQNIYDLIFNTVVVHKKLRNDNL